MTSQARIQLPDKETQAPAPAEGNCRELREILNRVGDKWSLQIVGELAQDPRRFGEIRRNVDGISQRMLTLTLRLLERDGLVSRTVYATTPPSVEYELTPLGRTLIEPVRALAGWAREHRGAIRAAHGRFDAQAQVGPAARRGVLRASSRSG